jgi:hypothetical protein
MKTSNPPKTQLKPVPRENFKFLVLFPITRNQSSRLNPTIAFDYSPAIA